MEVKEILDYVLMAWPAIAAIAAFTPTPKDDALLMPIRKLLDIVSFNFGFAKNEKK